MPCSFTYKNYHCQFDVNEKNLVTLPDGTVWCNFHCPMEYRSNGEDCLSQKSLWTADQINVFNQKIIKFIQKNSEDTLCDNTISLVGVVFPGDFVCNNTVLPSIDFGAAEFSGDVWFCETQFSGDASFFETKFNQDVWFLESEFCKDSWFIEAKFNQDAFFSKSLFKDKAWFLRAEFNRDAFFNDVQFQNKAWFRSTRFNRDVSFENVSFNDKVWFRKSHFNGHALFNKSLFDNNTWFLNTTFRGDATFSDSLFTGDTSFSESQFNAAAKFNGTTFSGDTSFCETTFNTDASFKQVRFNGDTSFMDAQFDGNAWFHKAQFNNTACFSNADFKGSAEFCEVRFNDAAEFSKVRFYDSVNFVGDETRNSSTLESCVERDIFHKISFNKARIDGIALFNNRKFKNSTDFGGCIFGQSPKFHNCELHQDTNFSGSVFRDTHSEPATRDYRTLRLAMAKLRATEEQSKFYALEQKSKQNKVDCPTSIKYLSILHELTSDFGRSIVRPLNILFFTITLFYLGYMIQSDYEVSSKNSPEIMFVAIKQSIKPFDAFTNVGEREINKLFGTNKRTIQLIALVQSLISIVLITLALLAIRWEFRKG